MMYNTGTKLIKKYIVFGNRDVTIRHCPQHACLHFDFSIVMLSNIDPAFDKDVAPVGPALTILLERMPLQRTPFA